MPKQFKNGVLLHMRENASIYLFTTVLFLMGVIFGSIIVNSLNLTQKQDLYYYLSRFFGQVADGQFSEASLMLQHSFFHNMKYTALMWLLGLSIIGLPIILILLFLKGVVVGFTVGFLVNQLGWYGFMLSFVSVLPQNLIIVPAFIIVGTVAVGFSMKMIRQQFLKRMTEPFFPSFLRYTLLTAIMLVCIGGASLFEAYVSPTLMKGVIDFIYN